MNQTGSEDPFYGRNNIIMIVSADRVNLGGTRRMINMPAIIADAGEITAYYHMGT
jgi:hypothetical protein